MHLGSSKDSFPCFTRLKTCVAQCFTIRYLGFSHLREEGSLDYDGGFVRLQIHVNFDTIIYRQQAPFFGDVVGEQAIKIQSSIAFFFNIFQFFFLFSFAYLNFDHPKKSI
jgi:hypothetical protein